LFALVASLSIVQVPVKNSQVAVSDDSYQAAAWMDRHADRQGWEYPDNYVFSQWGQNRMYNYFVNGQARSYAYAQDNFGNFSIDTAGERWYERLRDQVGFVVVEGGDYPPNSIHARLFDAYGGAAGNGTGLSHYRAVFVSDSGARKVFTLVPGARITGPGEPNTTYEFTTDVTVSGETFTYTKRVRTDRTGIYNVRVPYAGEYAADGTAVDVSRSDVEAGAIHERFEGTGDRYWAFDSGSGEMAYEQVDGQHANLRGVAWTSGVSRSGIELNPSDAAHARAPPIENDTSAFTVSAWIRPTENASGAILSTGKDGGARSHYGLLFDLGHSSGQADRLGLYVGNGTGSDHWRSPELGLSYPMDRYHHVAVVFDRGEIRWYLDGEPIGNSTIDTERAVHDGERHTFIGREFTDYGNREYFDGALDEVRYYPSALPEGEVESLYEAHAGARNGSD